MYSSGKYLIHAEIRTNGVVERSDVVGAIFGQTEGLLGEQLDLRDLQDSSKIGRIDVRIDSEDGRSFGTVTIASGLDRVETAVLAAALETIERVGPCRAECTITDIEDARAAKRRELVGRATELLSDLEERTVTSEQIVEEVRQQARVEEITEHEGLPAGPRVADSDAIIVVEGRADVRRLLKYGIKNAIAVEGTDVPDAIAELTRNRNTTAFLDGDRGGDLILQELTQVGNVDYVAFAPSGQSVEDLDRTTILSALRKKVPYEHVADERSPREAVTPSDTAQPTAAPEDGSTPAGQSGSDGEVAADAAGETATTAETAPDGAAQSASGTPSAEQTATRDDAVDADAAGADADDATSDDGTDQKPAETLPGHVEAVIERGSGTARLLDASFAVIEEVEADDAFDAIADAETVPETVVLDGTVTQRLLDVAAQRGVGQLVGTDTGEFVKQPASVRVRTAENRTQVET